MPSSTVYLHYFERRGADPDEDDEDLESQERNYDEEESEYDSQEDQTFIEFVPVRLTSIEPAKDNILELDLDFAAKVGDTLHLVVVRYNHPRIGSTEEWCVEGVFNNGDLAEDMVDSLDEGISNAECAKDRDSDLVIVKAEVFSLILHK